MMSKKINHFPYFEYYLYHYFLDNKNLLIFRHYFVLNIFSFGIQQYSGFFQQFEFFVHNLNLKIHFIFLNNTINYKKKILLLFKFPN